MKNNEKWRWFGFIVGAVAVLTAVGIGGFIANKPAKPGAPCGIPDTYGFHMYNDPIREVTCPDRRQQFKIERMGESMGVYEYRCHCD